MDRINIVDAGLLSILVCPRDRLSLRESDRFLVCERGHRYPVVDGIPILLCVEKPNTLNLALESIFAAESGTGAPFYLNTVGSITEDRKRKIEADLVRGDMVIDPVVSWRVLATSGYGYASMLGKMKSYPIPDIPFDPAKPNQLLLDVGCNWGRWSLSAARKGWHVVGIDPSLGALLAARRMAAAEKQQITLVCGDARFMPFKHNIFDAVFSYSVLQHFEETQATLALEEIGRILIPNSGRSKIQMAHRFGLRSMYHRASRDYAESGGYRVRYWKWSQLLHVFECAIGPSSISAEAFGGLGLLYSDRRNLPPTVRLAIVISEALKRASHVLPLLRFFSDSVMIESRKRL